MIIQHSNHIQLGRMFCSEGDCAGNDVSCKMDAVVCSSGLPFPGGAFMSRDMHKHFQGSVVTVFAINYVHVHGKNYAI